MVAAPVNEDLNEEDDETPEENALAETAAVEKKAAKGVAKQHKVTWVGDKQAGADGKQMYRWAKCTFWPRPALILDCIGTSLLLAKHPAGSFLLTRYHSTKPHQ